MLMAGSCGRYRECGLLLAAAILVGVVVLPISAGAAVKSSPTKWTGYGALLQNFKRVHPKTTYHCSAGGCYGTPYKNGSAGQYAQFISVDVSSTGRVIGYSQTWGSTLSLVKAKAQVLKMMPTDIRTTAIWVNHDSQGNTCVFWNLKSKTLGQWFGDRKTGDPSGTVGVTLEHFNARSELASDSATQLNLAVVDLVPDQKGTDC